VIRVLFVCLGNICRSPMADAVFSQRVREAGLEGQIEVDSAGTSGWHAGEKAHWGTLDVLRRNNIPYDGRSRRFTRADLDDFDYVLTMDHSNYQNVQRVVTPGATAEVAMFLSYAGVEGKTTVTEVPDPYYHDNFDEVYELVTLGADALLRKIRTDRNL
jgi:protein-tyrosine phosphatase